MNKWPITPVLISGFCCMKRLGIFVLLLGWDASPSQGFPRHLICRHPFIHLGGERHCESEVSCLRTQGNGPHRASTRLVYIERKLKSTLVVELGLSSILEQTC